MINLIINRIKFLNDLTPKQRAQELPLFQNLINDLNLIKLNYEKRVSILLELLNFCVEIDTEYLLQDVVKIILDKWCNDDLDIDGVIGDLANIPECKESILIYLAKIFEYSNPITILDSHIRTRYGDGSIFSFVADRILKAYHKAGRIPNENLEMRDWQTLIEAAKDTNEELDFENFNYYENLHFVSRQANPMTHDNKDIIEYIGLKFLEIENKNKKPKKPKWIKVPELQSLELLAPGTNSLELLAPGTNSLELLAPGTKSLKFPELKELADKFLEPEKIQPNDTGDVAPIKRDEIIKNFVSLRASLPGIKDFNIDDFRTYGPINAIEDMSCISGVREDEPCRMFSCICREFDDDEAFEDNEIDSSQNLSWFRGECDVCSRKIENYKYAVRFPVDGGGWLGCYCGFKCMLKTTVRPIYQSDEHRILEIKNMLMENGISA